MTTPRVQNKSAEDEAKIEANRIEQQKRDDDAAKFAATRERFERDDLLRGEPAHWKRIGESDVKPKDVVAEIDSVDELRRFQSGRYENKKEGVSLNYDQDTQKISIKIDPNNPYGNPEQGFEKSAKAMVDFMADKGAKKIDHC